MEITEDKKKHFLYGGIIAMITMCVLIIFITAILAAFCGVVMSLIAGLVKDVIIDKILGLGTFEWLDIFATVLGGIVGSLLLYYVVELLNVWFRI